MARPLQTPRCHPEKRHYAHGLCKNCYDREKRRALGVVSEAPVPQPADIKVANPATAEHVATMMLKHQMDARGAVQEMVPGLTPAEVSVTAQKIESAPQVRAAIEKALEASGLDDQSKKRYVQMMWEWLTGNDPMKAQCAARILGKAFIGERIDVNKPEPLQIVGFDEGVSRLLSDPDEREVN